MFGNILIFLIILMIAADAYIFALFIRKRIRRQVVRLLWFVPALLLTVVYFYDPDGHLRDVFRIVFLSVALPKIVLTVVSLPDLPFRYFFKWKIYPFTMLALAIAAALVYAIIYGGTLGATHFKVREMEFVSPHLPEAFDGYKIVHISDMHLRCWENKKSAIEQLVEIINSQQPDAVAATGDLVHNTATELDGFEGFLSSIKAPDGVYSVLGNHDYGYYRRWESEEAKIRNMQDLIQRKADMGWTLLNNAHTFIAKGNDSIAIIGVENSGNPPFPDYGNLPEAMKGTENRTFRILLSHDPTLWRREALHTGIDLTLSGHTHAAQFIFGGFSPAAFVYSEWGGMYREGNRGLYVNAGIGHVFIPFRFGAWPEITVICLKHSKTDPYTVKK